MKSLRSLGILGALLVPLAASVLSPLPASASTASCQPATAAPTDPYPGTTVIADNFESGSLSPFIVHTAGTGAATVSSAAARSGACAAYLHVTSDVGSLAYFSYPLPAGTQAVYADGWFDIAQAGVAGNDVPYFRFLSGSTRIADIYRYNSNGQLWLRTATPTGGFVYTRLPAPTIGLNAWHHAVMHVVPSGAATTIQVWFDGQLVYSNNQVSTGASTLSAVQLGAEHNSQMGDSYSDDVIVKMGR